MFKVQNQLSKNFFFTEGSPKVFPRATPAAVLHLTTVSHTLDVQSSNLIQHLSSVGQPVESNNKKETNPTNANTYIRPFYIQANPGVAPC